MSHQNGIGAFRIEFTCDFVSDIDVFKGTSAIKFERFGQQEISRLNNKTFVNLLFDFATSLMYNSVGVIINIQLCT